MSPSVTVRLLATQSDARLVELARQGHERAFEALVQRYRRPLLGYCRRVLLPEARAEDALQQALLQAWLALQRGDEVRDARAWLYRIARNTALNALRGSGYDYAQLSEALSGANAPQEDLDRRIAVREALAGLAALPPQQREALLRTAVEGVSHADAAAQMGVSEGALRGLVHRARTTLRTAATAITPMPLASWAAGAAGHGAAVADVAVGGGSAGLLGLLVNGESSGLGTSGAAIDGGSG
jgi:RNA polymerase sigma factor (sigma-70 family)